MPTARQKKAVEKISELVRNPDKTIGEALIESGYSKSVSESPQRVTESKGFLELCEDCGLTDKFILDALTEDIKMKPQNRKPELELAAKMKKLTSDKVDVNLSGAISLSGLFNSVIPENAPK